MGESMGISDYFCGKHCKDCGGEFHPFRWIYKCGCCDKEFCSSCLYITKDFTYLSGDPFKKNEVCSNCFDKVYRPLRSKYLKAEENSHNIDLISINYKGKVNYKPKSEQKIETRWTKDSDDADMYLSVTAAFLGCDAVINVKTEKSPRRDGNYIYKLYRMTGTGVKLK